MDKSFVRGPAQVVAWPIQSTFYAMLPAGCFLWLLLTEPLRTVPLIFAGWRPAVLSSADWGVCADEDEGDCRYAQGECAEFFQLEGRFPAVEAVCIIGFVWMLHQMWLILFIITQFSAFSCVRP